MLGDHRLSRGGQPDREMRFQKIYGFDRWTGVGLSGIVCDAGAAMDSWHAFAARTRGMTRHLTEHLEEWRAHVHENEPTIATPKKSLSRLLVLRLYDDPQMPISRGRVCEVVLPHPGNSGGIDVIEHDFMRPASIGEGAGIDEYVAALEQVATPERMVEFANLQLTGGPEIMGIGMIAAVLRDVIRDTVTTSISDDLLGCAFAREGDPACFKIAPRVPDPSPILTWPKDRDRLCGSAADPPLAC
jgi:hypothetical protein